jgi:hypothetical protein
MDLTPQPAAGSGGIFRYPGNPHQGQILAVAPFALRIFPPPLLESDYLRTKGLLDNLACDAGASDNRIAERGFIVPAERQYPVECHAVAGFARKRHDANGISRSDLVLFAACRDDCVQFSALRFPIV